MHPQSSGCVNSIGNIMKLYGYRLDEKRKFTVDVEDICKCINCDDGFSDDYFVYTTAENRDFHYNENIKG